MLFRCINYTASDYLKENSAIKLILWAQNKGNCQKESVHPKSHEKKNNWQTFSACSFMECSLSLLMFNQPPPLAQMKSYNVRTGGGTQPASLLNSRWVKHFKSDPKHPPSSHGDPEGWTSRGENCNSMRKKIRMLDSGVLGVLQSSPESFPAALEHTRGQASSCASKSLMPDPCLRVGKGEEQSLEWLWSGTTAQMALDHTAQVCQKPPKPRGMAYCFFPCSPAPNFISVLPVLNSELSLKNSEFIA